MYSINITALILVIYVMYVHSYGNGQQFTIVFVVKNVEKTVQNRPPPPHKTVCFGHIFVHDTVQYNVLVNILAIEEG